VCSRPIAVRTTRSGTQRPRRVAAPADAGLVDRHVNPGVREYTRRAQRQHVEETQSFDPFSDLSRLGHGRNERVPVDLLAVDPTRSVQYAMCGDVNKPVRQPAAVNSSDR
jgi:hypothetical protein